MRYHRKAAFIGCFGSIAVTIGLCVGWPIWVMEAPAVPQYKMAFLRIGMLKADVQRLLGEPTGRYPQVEGFESWTYSRGTWAILHVYFEREGKMTQWVHDR